MSVDVGGGLVLEGIAVDGPGLCGSVPAHGGAEVGGGLRVVGRRRCTAAQAALRARAQLYIDAAHNGGDGTNEGLAGAALDGVSATAVDPAVEKAALYGANELQASSCPDAAALDLITGFVVWVDMDSVWQKPLPSSILAKPVDGGTVPGETEDCYAVGVGADGAPYAEWQDAVGGHTIGGFFAGSDATVDVIFGRDDGRKQFGLEFIGDNGAGGWTVRYYTGTPTSHVMVSEIVNTTDGAQTMVTSSEALRVGDFSYGAVYRLRLYDELGGTLLRDFFPERDHTTGDSMTSGTGEVWSNVLIPTVPAFPYMEIPDDPALDVAADADATFAFWLTSPYEPSDGDTYPYAARETGTLGFNGNGIKLVDWLVSAFFIDFAAAIVGDGTDQAIAMGDHLEPGTHLHVVTVDRAADESTWYVDNVEFATADITAVGALAPAADLILGSAAHHAVAKWDEIVAPAEIAALRA